MTEETIVGVYATAARAEAAVADLYSAGVPERAINVHTRNASAAGAAVHEAGRHETGFWAGLFGGEPDHDTAVYDRSLQDGATVVTVRTPDTQVARIMDILELHDPVDVEQRAAEYGLTHGTSAAVPGSPAVPATGAVRDQETLQLAEEQIQVGKRVVNRGGTRIRRYVVETPVTQDISLHSETVTLERRPVTDGRPVGDSFTEKTLELNETAEEAVISKTARVYEEVGLRKDVTDRVETVRDTVRKEEVEVEQIPVGAAGTAATTGDTTLAGRNPRL